MRDLNGRMAVWLDSETWESWLQIVSEGYYTEGALQFYLLTLHLFRFLRILCRSDVFA